MTYYLGRRSLRRLQGVHPDLVQVIKAAIDITPIDFTVLEGLRSIERQSQLLQRGASKTMHSRHLTGHAVDLGAYLDQGVRWDFGLYVQIAEAMQQAAIGENIPVEWGGCWSCLDEEDDLQAAVAGYVQRKRDNGKPAFIDAGHFQLPWSVYPIHVSKRGA